MPPSWTPICRAMYRYCESYFTAINRWRLAGNRELLVNRLELLQTVHNIFEQACESDKVYEFKVFWERQDVPLWEEVLPTELEYSQDADTRAFQLAKEIVPLSMFNRAGVFFQIHVLKPAAGFSEERLGRSNPASRSSALAACEVVLRLPIEAGRGRIVYRRVTDDEDEEELRVFTSASLGPQGFSLVDVLLGEGLASPPPLTANTSKKRARSSGVQAPVWDKTHASVGSRVAAYFPVPVASPPPRRTGPARQQMKLFYGRVAGYQAPSKK
eukprot:gene44017-53809_t